jgi:hypothetical protein
MPEHYKKGTRSGSHHESSRGRVPPFFSAARHPRCFAVDIMSVSAFVAAVPNASLLGTC